MLFTITKGEYLGRLWIFSQILVSKEPTSELVRLAILSYIYVKYSLNIIWNLCESSDIVFRKKSSSTNILCNGEFSLKCEVCP
jgi:hypothetical protein